MCKRLTSTRILLFTVVHQPFRMISKTMRRTNRVSRTITARQQIYLSSNSRTLWTDAPTVSDGFTANIDTAIKGDVDSNLEDGQSNEIIVGANIFVYQNPEHL